MVPEKVLFHVSKVSFPLCVFTKQEVIQLTLDLIGQKQGPAEDEGAAGEGSSKETTGTKRAPVRHWEPGDKCLALYSEDKK